VRLPRTLPKDSHTDLMRDDAITDTVSHILEKDSSAVLIYISTPPHSNKKYPHDIEDVAAYEMDDPYPSSLHTELKRDTMHHARQDGDDDFQKGLPLFEKYQFFSPGKHIQP
jgi:hypothetical protein